ncbi:hypothetical protein T484DRAFT_1954336 [Baffinella frigidus]|nr:hypothetical protein T484DRAFT_1954336 [Cryptophyta sp. CCMP2293]
MCTHVVHQVPGAREGLAARLADMQPRPLALRAPFLQRIILLFLLLPLLILLRRHLLGPCRSRAPRRPDESPCGRRRCASTRSVSSPTLRPLPLP